MCSASCSQSIHPRPRRRGPNSWFPAIAVLVLLLIGTIPATAAPDDTPLFFPQPHQQQLNITIYQDRWDEALTLAATLLDSLPDDVIVLDQIGLLYNGSRHPDALTLIQSRMNDDETDAVSHLARALNAYYRGQYEDALVEFDAAIAGFSATGDSLGRSLAGLRKSFSLRRMKRPEDALTTLLDASSTMATLGGSRYELRCLSTEALVRMDLGQRDEVESLLEDAIERSRAIGDRYMEGRCLMSVSSNAQARGTYDRGIEYALAAAQVADEIGEKRIAVERRMVATRNLASQGRLADAIDQLGPILERTREGGHEELEMRALRDIGSAVRRSGDPEGALDYYERALAVGDPDDLPNERLRVLLFKGNALNDVARFRDALEVFRELRTRRISRAGLLGAIINGQGNAFMGLAELDSASTCYEEALVLASGQSYRPSVAMYTGNLAGCLAVRGEYQAALARYDEAATMFEGMNRHIEVSTTHLNMAGVYIKIGRYELADRHARQALDILTRIESRRKRAGCEITIGRIAEQQEDLTAAREWYERGRETADAAGDAYDATRAILNLADLETAGGKLEEAEAHYRSALATAEANGYQLHTQGALKGLARVAEQRQDLPAARDYFLQVLAVADETRSDRLRIAPAFELASVYRDLGEDALAREYFELAIATLERLRTGVGSEEERRVYFADFSRIYEEYIAFRWRAAAPKPGPHESEELFRLVESHRARTFVDLMEEQAVDPDRSISRELIHERREVLARYDRTHSKLGRRMRTLRRDGMADESTLATDSTLVALAGRIDLLNEEYDRIEGRIRQERIVRFGLDEFTPPSVNDIVALLDAETAFLEYAPLRRGEDDLVLVFCITPRHGLVIQELSPDALGAIDEFRSILSSGKTPMTFPAPRYVEVAHDLHRALVEPILLYLNEVSRLIIVPSGPLATIPFEALLTRDATDDLDRNLAESLARFPYLFHSWSVTYAPSGSALLKLRRSAHRNGRTPEPSIWAPRYLVIAGPEYGVGSTTIDPPRLESGSSTRGRQARDYQFEPLPHALEEGRTIVELVGEFADFYSGADATEERVKSEDLGLYHHIHFAAHAVVDEEAPLLSALVLTQDDDPTEDGFLTMREIYDLDLDADLVVLSSCRTATGKAYRGEGVVTLARPFLSAGSRSTLVSLWPVDDFSTATWMGDFYRSLADGEGAEAALRRARDGMVTSTRPLWRLPYYWAPFVMIGDTQ